jgi:hypothetical protein
MQYLSRTWQTMANIYPAKVFATHSNRRNISYSHSLDFSDERAIFDRATYTKS